jgi:hypothetical protein
MRSREGSESKEKYPAARSSSFSNSGVLASCGVAGLARGSNGTVFIVRVLLYLAAVGLNETLDGRIYG